MENRLFDLYGASQEISSYFNFYMLIYNSIFPLPEAVLKVVPDDDRK